MPGLTPGQLRPLATVTRSGMVESVHSGVAVGLAADGSIAVAAGDPHARIYPRSANKPIQADAMLRLGWSPTPEQLALACASHAGTPPHLAVVESTLAAAGLTVADLANTADLPLDRAAAHAVIRNRGGPSPLLQNCSGKHAAMLATCVANGWPTEGYLAGGHPLQVAITARVAELTGQEDVYVGVDGCGAPTHAAPLSGLARAFAVLAGPGQPVHSAMTAHPGLVDGNGRVVTELMRAVPGLVAKSGAEGVFAAALPDGRAAAVKIGDGAGRAAGVVLASVLAVLGVDVEPGRFAEPVLGHGSPIGTVTSLITR